MKINSKLAAAARRKGICESWFNRLRETEDMGELIKMYLEGIDFCLSNEFPSNEFIRRHFVGRCEAYGVFLDEAIAVKNSPYVVALGQSNGEAQYDSFNVGQVFAKHGSKLTIRASGHSFVMVDLFDESRLEVTAAGNAKICINHFGGNLTTTTQDDTAVIKVIRKKSKTY